MSRDLYSVLELEKGADASEIRKQYIKLSRQWHPDKVVPEKKDEATVKFQEISRAYEVLNDDQSKAFYDQTGQVPGENGGGPPPGHGGGMPFGMGGGMPFGFDMGDLFGMFGGGRGGGGPQRGGRRPGKPPARKTQIAMTLKDFYFGRTLQIHLERQRFCGGCKGEGALNFKSCGDCGGSGTKTQIVQMGPMIMHNQGPCMTCRGSGKTKGDSCGQCSGSKFIKQDKNLELVIKKGMRPGDCITFNGESSHVEEFTEPGDVIVEVIAADEDSGWERAGDILRHRVGLTLGEALAGKVVRLDGHPAHDAGLFIQIPAGVQNRQEIVVEGLGMPRGETGGMGDAVLVLTVMPTREEKAVLEANTDALRTMFGASAGETGAGLIWAAKPLVY
jgi:DnaJ family protein A protein 2